MIPALIYYNILKMASIEGKLITSSSQTRIQVAVFGTDLPANFSLHICMSRIPCLWLLPIRKQAMHAGLLNLGIPQHSAEESFCLTLNTFICQRKIQIM